MAFDNNVVLVGNVTRDPELRFTSSGVAVASFGLAWNQKSRDGDETAHFFDVTAWRQLGENLSESITKGMRVIVYGRLDYRTYETANGDKRTAIQIVADEVSPSLRWATAQVTRNERSSGGDSGGGGGSGSGSGGDGAPATGQAPTYDLDEEPF